MSPARIPPQPVWLAVDIVLFTVRPAESGRGRAPARGRLAVLLHRRAHAPAADAWALPGGFVGAEEDPGDAARRVLAEKVHLQDVFIEQLYTFGRPDRDPRSRVVSVAYFALVPPERLLDATGDPRLFDLIVPWAGELGGPVHLAGLNASLPFDHGEILSMAVRRLRGKLGYSNVGFELLPPAFTLRDLRQLHEAILDVGLNKDSFRRSVVQRGLVEPTGAKEEGVDHRPAELYRFRA